MKKLMPLLIVLLILLVLVTFRIYAPRVEDIPDEKSGLDGEILVENPIEESNPVEEDLLGEEIVLDLVANENEGDLSQVEIADEKLMIDEEVTLKEKVDTKEKDLADGETLFDLEKTLDKEPVIDIKAESQEKAHESIDDSLNRENPELVFTYTPLSEEVMERIRGLSYLENDKIKMEDLSYLRLSHWGFDDKVHLGELIVNKKIASQVVELFKDLYEAKFPIEKMRLIDDYKAKDNLSMADNNSSAFCFREIAGSNGVLSQHSFGLAIDINPVQNPYVKNGRVYPEGGKAYLDRNDIRKGMIVKGDPAYKAFKSRGWNWGGDWNSLKDYQHFEFKLD